MEPKEQSTLLLTLFKRNFWLVGLGLLFAGIVMILLSDVVAPPGKLATLLTHIGVSLIPAGTILIAYEYYMRREFLDLMMTTMAETLATSDIHDKLARLQQTISLVNNLRPTGLRRIHANRLDIDFRQLILSAPPNTHIKILGTALSCLDNWPMQEAMKTKLAAGCHIKLLSLNPDSAFVKQRAEEEKREVEDIEIDIRRTNEKNENFIRHLPPDLRSRIQLLHYNAPPVCFVFATEELVIASLYLREKRGEFFPHLELEVKQGGIHECFVRHFDSLWQVVSAVGNASEAANKALQTDR